MDVDSEIFGRGDNGGLGAGNRDGVAAVAAADSDGFAAIVRVAEGEKCSPDDARRGGGGGGGADDGDGKEGSASRGLRSKSTEATPLATTPPLPPLRLAPFLADVAVVAVAAARDLAGEVTVAAAGREPSTRKLDGLLILTLVVMLLTSRSPSPVDDLRPPSSSLQPPVVPRGERDRSPEPPGRCLRVPAAVEAVPHACTRGVTREKASRRLEGSIWWVSLSNDMYT